MSKRALSKSRYLSGLQCPLLLWTHFNDRGAIPPPDAATQWIFDTGHRVGALAQSLWPDGEEVPLSRKLEKTAEWTRELLRRRIPIFEASFLIDGRYCRSDILEPVGVNAWNMIEVKSSTKVKEVNLHDVAFQANALRRAGLRLERLELMHIDRSYVRQGELDAAGLFHREDVTDRAVAYGEGLDERVDAMHAIISGERPIVDIGAHCHSPYNCDLIEQCWRGQARERNVGRAPHEHQVRPDGLREWLDRLEYPIHHFDFETMATALPRFQRTRPYQRIPFQFSLHIEPTPGGECEHVEFLSMDPIDPRPLLLEALEAIGPTGTVLVFNESFEKSVLRELARDFPHATALVDDLIGRMQDLIVPFRAWDLYDPSQHGSCSLKDVLPAWTSLDYADLQIGDGQQAAREYEQAVFGDQSFEQRDRVAAALREYCGQDTWAMVELLRVARELAG